MAKEESLTTGFLKKLCEENSPVSIFLVNGIKLQGQLENFDQEVLLLKGGSSQLIFKHAVSTIVPNKAQ